MIRTPTGVRAVAHPNGCPDPKRPCLACGRAIGPDQEAGIDEVGNLGIGPVHAATCMRRLISDDWDLLGLPQPEQLGSWDDEPPL